MKFDADLRESHLYGVFDRVMEDGFEALDDAIERNAERKRQLDSIDYWEFSKGLDRECWPGTNVQQAQDVRVKWYAVQPWYVMLGLMRQCVDRCDGQQKITLTKKVEGFHVQITRSGIWGKDEDKASKKGRCSKALIGDVVHVLPVLPVDL